MGSRLSCVVPKAAAPEVAAATGPCPRGRRWRSAALQELSTCHAKLQQGTSALIQRTWVEGFLHRARDVPCRLEKLNNQELRVRLMIEWSPKVDCILHEHECPAARRQLHEAYKNCKNGHHPLWGRLAPAPGRMHSCSKPSNSNNASIE